MEYSLFGAGRRAPQRCFEKVRLRKATANALLISWPKLVLVPQRALSLATSPLSDLRNSRVDFEGSFHRSTLLS